MNVLAELPAVLVSHIAAEWLDFVEITFLDEALGGRFRDSTLSDVICSSKPAYCSKRCNSLNDDDNLSFACWLLDRGIAVTHLNLAKEDTANACGVDLAKICSVHLR
jgi:hypothetical protein